MTKIILGLSILFPILLISINHHEFLCHKEYSRSCRFSLFFTGQKQRREVLSKMCQLKEVRACQSYSLLLRQAREFQASFNLNEQMCKFDKVDTSCYQAAVDSCLLNNSSNALEYLYQAAELGFDNYMAVDFGHDMDCIKGQKNFNYLLNKVKRNHKQESLFK